MLRIQRDDLEEATVQLKTPPSFLSASQNGKPTSVVYFTIKGKEDRFGTKLGEECEEGYPLLDEDSDDAYAKADYTKRTPKYFVKVGNTGFFIDPHGLFKEDRRQAKIRGKNKIEYRAVNESSFLYYIQFLKTLNKQHLRQAMREMQ